MNRVTILETLSVLALACLILGWYFPKSGFLIGCGCFLALGVFPNPVAGTLVKVWLRIGVVLGAVMTPIILTGVYFLCLVPLAILSRPFTKESRRYFYTNDRASFFIPTEKAVANEDFEKPW